MHVPGIHRSIELASGFMCGRFYLDTPREHLREQFALKQMPLLAGRFNIAPSQDIAAIREGEAGRELVMLHWGLIPHWAKEEKTKFSMINARAETVATKPAYRSAFRQRRCLVPASGFFEWKPTGRGRQPYAVRLKDTDLFAFAGLWEHWEGEDGKTIESCTIIVTNANELLLPIHDRMPVILAPADYDDWLDSKTAEPDCLLTLLRPYLDKQMTLYPVSQRVNSPKNDDPECIEQISRDYAERAQ